MNSGRPRFSSVRLPFFSGLERFEWFRFSVPAVPLQKRLFCVSVQFNRKGRFRPPVSVPANFLENGSGGSAFGFGKKIGSKQKGPAEQVAQKECLPSKFADFECAFSL